MSRAWISGLCLLLLAGCGSGGGGPENPPAPTPSHAPPPIPAPPPPGPQARAPLPPWLAYCDGPCVSPYFVLVNGAPVFARFSTDEELAALWSLTPLPFEAMTFKVPLFTMHWFQAPTFEPDIPPASLLDAFAPIFEAERQVTGVPTPGRVEVFLLPTELAAAQPFGEGNFSFGHGLITLNYGNPPYLAQVGGLLNVVRPTFAHEYAHELYYLAESEMPGTNFFCLREGVANALGVKVGAIPVATLGPIGVQGADFSLGCAATSEPHERGNCFLWHVFHAELLTDAFMYWLYHPQSPLQFDSCAFDLHTGNNLWVYFSDAAPGVEWRPVIDAIGLPHAASLEDARRDL